MPDLRWEAVTDDGLANLETVGVERSSPRRRDRGCGIVNDGYVSAKLSRGKIQLFSMLVIVLPSSYQLSSIQS